MVVSPRTLDLTAVVALLELDAFALLEMALPVLELLELVSEGGVNGVVF